MAWITDEQGLPRISSRMVILSGKFPVVPCVLQTHNKLSENQKFLLFSPYFWGVVLGKVSSDAGQVKTEGSQRNSGPLAPSV